MEEALLCYFEYVVSKGRKFLLVCEVGGKVGHPKYWIKEHKGVTDTQARFALLVLESVLGPPHITLKSAMSALKAPQGSKTETRSCWEEQKTILYP